LVERKELNMGEMRYTLNNGNTVQFDEEGDCGCLCTFPFNDEVIGKKLSKGRIYSLALLGAAVAIQANTRDGLKGNYLPDCVPEWIRDEIDRLLRNE
jgi:hypothetical protein